MDWLRSEDLKEEKNVTTSTAIIAALPLWRRQEAGEAWHRHMSRLHLHRPVSGASNRSAAADVLVREANPPEDGHMKASLQKYLWA
jgi:hypothetical protein